MPSALYYPHTVIRSPGLIRTALLLWDDVSCIVPRKNWHAERPFKDRSLNEALDLLVRDYVPSYHEKQRAHRDVSEFIRDEASHYLMTSMLIRGYPGDYLIYPEKFLDGTWHILESAGLAHFDRESSDYGVPPALGMLMMSSLADACAGTQKLKVTDHTEAYMLLERARATLLGAPFVEGLDASQVAPELDRLVTISLRLVDARRVSIKRLLNFRKREAKSNSPDYRKMRARYFDAVNSYVRKVLKEAKSQADVREMEKQFELDIKDDLKSLKKELGYATLESLFSKEIALTVMAVAGALAAPISGITSLAISMKGVGIVSLVATMIKHKKERRKALLSHSMSWLYLAGEPHLAVR